MSPPEANCLRAWGLDDEMLRLIDAPAQAARVVQVDRGECDVVTAAGLARVSSDSVRAQSETAPVTGDWVTLARNDDAAVIQRVMPRRNVLARRDPAGRFSEQVLAANFEAVGLVAALDQPLPPGRLERMLVMARDSGASIVMLLSKADRACDAETATADAVRATVAALPSLSVSVVSGAGLVELRAAIGFGRTMVLIGASGSGKSSLVNALAGAEIVATAEVRPSDRRGRHTTAARRLVLLPDGAGLVLDTPGLRAVGVTDAHEALQAVFEDIVNLARGCRFSDCAHGAEPDCEISAAVRRGEADEMRVRRFLALRAEIDEQRKLDEARSRRSGKAHR